MSAPPLPWYARPFVALQWLLPHHLLSAGMYALTRVRWRPFKDFLIRRFVRLYGVDMGEAAESDTRAYPHFNAFFTRRLRADARPLATEPTAVLGPADGVLSQAGSLDAGRLLQAKGVNYDLTDLLGGERQWARRFEGGLFATVYLSPRDYHRVHMPMEGRLKRMLHVPGRLFSVSPLTTALVPGLFTRNERVVCLFETAVGPMAVILVGAVFVGGIDTVWAGCVAPAGRRVSRWNYAEPLPAVTLERGAELGRFNMGSTVILLFPPGRVRWDPDLRPGRRLRMGEALGWIQASSKAKA